MCWVTCSWSLTCVLFGVFSGAGVGVCWFASAYRRESLRHTSRILVSELISLILVICVFYICLELIWILFKKKTGSWIQNVTSTLRWLLVARVSCLVSGSTIGFSHVWHHVFSVFRQCGVELEMAF